MTTDSPYRTDLINAAMGARRLTNKAVAEKAGVGVMTVSKIRNGNPRVSFTTFKKVVEALGLTIAEVSALGLLESTPKVARFFTVGLIVSTTPATEVALSGSPEFSLILCYRS